jgi:hypothetical protein
LSANSNQPNDGSRRRIVIPLGQPPGQPIPGAQGKVKVKIDSRTLAARPRRSRARKILAVLGITVLVMLSLAAGGVFFWWQHYKTTPAYSLALLIDAAQHDDMTTVDTIIDSEKVVDNFAGEVANKAAGRYGLALGPGTRKQIEAVTPTLLPIIRENARAALTARVKDISQQANRKPFVLVALGIPYLVNIAVSGDTAKATALVHDQQVELDMARAGTGWKIVAFRDDALVQRAVDQVIKNLPVIGNEKKAIVTGKHGKSLLPFGEPVIP